MKKVFVSSLIFINYFSIVSSEKIVLAVEDSKNTNAEVNFIVDENKKGGNPSIPGKDDEPLRPNDPGWYTDGPLRIEYVPNFKFGMQRISRENQTYDAFWNYGKDSKGKERIIPHFLQVTDERGNPNVSDAGFEVRLKASTFKEKDGDHELPNTRLQFRESTLVSSISKDADSILNGFMFDNEIDKKIVIDEEEKVILSTKLGKTSDGSKSYNVFSKDYSYNTFFGESKTIPKKNEGVQLFSPRADKKKEYVDYESTLTWIITYK